MPRVLGAGLRLYSEWVAVRGETDQSRRADRFRSLGREVGPLDVAQITSILTNGPEELRPAAASLLSSFALDRRGAAEGLTSAALAAAEAGVRREYPLSQIGIDCFIAMNRLSKEDAWRVFSIPALFRRALRVDADRTLRDLRVFGGAKAIPILRKLSARKGPIGQEAIRNLGVLGIHQPGEIERVAAEWRAKQTPQLLSKLYNMYVAGLEPGKTSAVEVKKLLGKPTRDEGRPGSVFYAPTNDTCLFLEQDERGKIIAHSFSG
jgi:hypothetical protein